MRIIPKANTLRKGILLYRGIRYRKGFGVHSPFVFNLITKVIEERCQYYSFYDIELIRKQLLFQDDEITYPDRQQKGKMRRRTIGRIFGPSMGLSTLYLTSYASDLKCIALENVPEFASIARIAFGKAARNPVDLRVGSYKDLLPKALKDMEQLDFVFFNTLYEQQNNIWLFEECLKHVHGDTVFVFEGIKTSRKMREFWREVCCHPEVTVTIDLYSMGIVFFNKKLHKRDYIVYF